MSSSGSGSASPLSSSSELSIEMANENTSFSEETGSMEGRDFALAKNQAEQWFAVALSVGVFIAKFTQSLS